MKLHEFVVENCGDDEAARVKSVCVIHELAQCPQVVTTANANFKALVHVALLDLVGHEVELFRLLSLRDWQRQRHERVESDAHTIAL